MRGDERVYSACHEGGRTSKIIQTFVKRRVDGTVKRFQHQIVSKARDHKVQSWTNGGQHMKPTTQLGTKQLREQW